MNGAGQWHRGQHLTNDEKRAHLIDLKCDYLIDQVCIQKFCYELSPNLGDERGQAAAA
jgi:hypothetical protein